jgi:hypothetical protein
MTVALAAHLKDTQSQKTSRVYPSGRGRSAAIW